MRDALLYGWQRHIVAIGALQVVLIADHRLVGLILEGDIDTGRDILGRETAFHFWTRLCHIAHCVCGLLQHDKPLNQAKDVMRTYW